MTLWGRVRRLVGEHGEHILFAVALAALVLLGMWWTRLLSETVELEAAASRALLALDLERAAHDGSLRDERMVVVSRFEATDLAATLPDDPSRAVDVAPFVLAELEQRHARRRLMVNGEGALLVGLLAVCVLMLYRLLSTAAAVQREMTYFVGQMTHEMKTPLAGLRALLETLQRGRVAQEDLPELIALGLQQVDREEHLVQTLLQAQRLRVAKEPLARQPVAVADLLQRFRAHRAKTPDSAAFELDADAAVVGNGDPDAVWTILENLVDNAVKFEARTVRLRGWKDGRHVYVACEDDGIGFASERGRDLFRAFHSAHSSNEARHGTGLGLFLSRRLARAMGGDLEGSSEGEGKGARFVLSLPLEGA